MYTSSLGPFRKTCVQSMFQSRGKETLVDFDPLIWQKRTRKHRYGIVTKAVLTFESNVTCRGKGGQRPSAFEFDGRSLSLSLSARYEMQSLQLEKRGRGLGEVEGGGRRRGRKALALYYNYLLPAAKFLHKGSALLHARSTRFLQRKVEQRNARHSRRPPPTQFHYTYYLLLVYFLIASSSPE